MKVICFDLEGPLSPQDNAYELMKLFPRGGKVFEVISRYDDLLTLEGRPGYEPGDTLALIAPFLALHGIQEKQIAAMGRAARLTAGATELICKLKLQGWDVFCISTSYQQYAITVTERLGIPGDNVACTGFPLTQIRKLLGRDESDLLEKAESKIIKLSPLADDTTIKEYLDHFYWQALPRTRLGAIMRQVRPVGGKRKVDALESFSQRAGKPLSGWVAVGDSITDFKMLQAVNKAGGLAVAFNANEYALPYATIGLASLNLYDLWPVLEAWERGGYQAVRDLVEERERAGGIEDREWFHWIAGTNDITRALEIHKRIRRLVRQEAAKLG